MRDIVVIGGSALGVQALCSLIEMLPEPFPAPLGSLCAAWGAYRLPLDDIAQLLSRLIVGGE
jgi:hypothetical protein